MAFRPLCCWLTLIALGCSTLASRAMTPDQEKAIVLWQKGQDAMRRGVPAEALRCYEQSLALDPTLTRNFLSLAAAHIEQGDDAAACPHLRRYVRAHPEQLTVHIHLADLEFRLRHLPEARAEFEQCVAAAQDSRDPTEGELLHCHAKLMEIAEAAEDEYAEHLHRGIGLCLLARQRAMLPEPDCDLSVEGLLCKAAGELTLAQSDHPDRARPNWYLYTIWTLLEQKPTALRCLKQAAAAAPFSGDLTTAERRHLQLQCQCETCSVRRR